MVMIDEYFSRERYEGFFSELSLKALAFTHNGVVPGSNPGGPTNIARFA